MTPNTKIRSVYDRCPECKADLRAAEIPLHHRKYYLPGSTHFSRLIGIVDASRDRVQTWRCPDCAYTHTSRSAFHFYDDQPKDDP